jgi:hypothetical protein
LTEAEREEEEEDMRLSFETYECSMMHDINGKMTIIYFRRTLR